METKTESKMRPTIINLERQSQPDGTSKYLVVSMVPVVFTDLWDVRVRPGDFISEDLAVRLSTTEFIRVHTQCKPTCPHEEVLKVVKDIYERVDNIHSEVVHVSTPPAEVFTTLTDSVDNLTRLLGSMYDSAVQKGVI